MTIVPVCHSQRVDIFACAQAGCRDCLEALLRGNEGLIHHILKRQGIGGIEYQDLIQEGRIALWRSILHFDPGEARHSQRMPGLPFTTGSGAAWRLQTSQGAMLKSRSGSICPAWPKKPGSRNSWDKCSGKNWNACRNDYGR